MTKITKKLRISLTAIAFVMGISAAFAGQYQAEKESDNSGAAQFDCQSNLNPSCGSSVSAIYVADTDEPADEGAYILQYQP